MRASSFAVGVLLLVGVSGCPVTDDYYLLSADTPGGTSGETGAGAASPDGGSHMLTAGTAPNGATGQGGAQQPPGGSSSAGNPTGGSGGTSSGSGGDMVGTVGGMADSGGQPSAGEAGAAGAGGEPCVPATERCNGHDDDCDDVIDEFVCPTNCSGFVLASGPEHGYMFCTGARKANWTDAKKACEDQDMRLAWLTSAAENSAVAQKLDSLGSDAEILFGATDQGNEGDWLWFGGSQFWKGDDKGKVVGGLYNSWSQGSPSNTNNEDCVLVNAMTGTWGDRTCNATYPYVCEQPDD